jgi:hypothetical protein
MDLRDRLNGDCARLVAQHKAALVIQSFFRRSQYKVGVEFNHLSLGSYRWPRMDFRVKHGVHPQHGKAKFFTDRVSPTNAVRSLSHRYKPLGLALKAMMRMILEERRGCREAKKRKKRKNIFVRVTLFRRLKHFQDMPKIASLSYFCLKVRIMTILA